MSEKTVTAPVTTAPAGEDDFPIKPRRNLIDWIGFPVVGFLVILFIYNLFTNPNWRWDVVGEYLFHPLVLQGVLTTIVLTLVSGVTGTIFGLILAGMRLSRSPLLRGIATAFIGFMRAIPALVLLLLIYFTSAVFPEVGFGIPFTDIMFYEIPVNAIITQFVAAWLGLTLIMGSHTGEIFRGGVISVPGGQVEAAKALGMSPSLTFFKVVMPQMIRVSIPALANELISLFKNTSLVSIIGYAELLTVVQSIYGRTYQTIPLLIVACIWYLVIVIISMLGQQRLEKRFGRGFGVGANA
ncbi:amino acid ABC transporter permease [Microbacterium sp.]|uniref:amino acid ABC transporter permease n=1 Tax=Microbacterium sp. TaxID=51671 RepID=UPI003A8BF7FD